MNKGSAWRVFVEQAPAETLQAIPPALAERVSQFILALGPAVGTAVARGERPLGAASDPATRQFNLMLPHTPVMIEYSLHPELHQIRIQVLLWIA